MTRLTGSVSNILALCQLSVHVHVDGWEVKGGILVHDALRLQVVLLLRDVIPPVLRVAVFIKLGALVVKPVRDLMSNHDSNPSIILRGWSRLPKKWGLQNAGRESCTREETELIIRIGRVIIHLLIELCCGE